MDQQLNLIRVITVLFLCEGSNSFELYTHLVANGNGKKIGIQALPTESFDNDIIALGVIAEKNENLTISAIPTALPSDIKVYLEDRKNNIILTSQIYQLFFDISKLLLVFFL